MNNSKITLTTVNEEALDAIKKLKDGSLDVQRAKEIRGMLNIIIDTARTQIEFLDTIPEDLKYDMGANKLKAIANTVDDTNQNLDVIESNHLKTHKKSEQDNPYKIIDNINSGS